MENTLEWYTHQRLGSAHFSGTGLTCLWPSRLIGLLWEDTAQTSSVKQKKPLLWWSKLITQEPVPSCGLVCDFHGWVMFSAGIRKMCCEHMFVLPATNIQDRVQLLRAIIHPDLDVASRYMVNCQIKLKCIKYIYCKVSRRIVKLVVSNMYDTSI